MQYQTFSIRAFTSTFIIAASALAQAQPIEVGNQKQLFIDSLFFASSENVALHVNPPAKTGERNVVSDQPWENASLNWFTVMDDEGKYRMWYECYDVEGWPTPDDTSFCYAESTDGVHWTKPALNLFQYHGSGDNNILFRQLGPDGAHSRVHGTDVFKDPHAPADARYKAVSQGQFKAENPPYRVAGMVSPDGLHWTRLAQPICDVFADSQYSGFWDDRTNQYTLYGRVSGRGRSIGYASSATFEHFEPLALTLQVEAEDAPETDLYNPAAIKYPGAANAYFMFPSMYHHTPDTLDIGLAVSRDGVHWTRPGGNAPFIALGVAGSFDSGSLYLGQGVIVKGGELWQYFSGGPLKHNEAELEPLSKPENKRVISRVVSRLDGFVSANAGDDTGTFTTRPLAVDGNKLTLNVSVKEGGEARVGILGADGNALPGFSLEDCAPIVGDHVNCVVSWKGGQTFGPAGKQTVTLRVQMKRSSLYAFQFGE